MKPRNAALSWSNVTMSEVLMVLEVRRHASISRAAIALHLTQSSLSKSIKRIERTLGMELFQRTAVGVEPRAECSRLFRYFDRLATTSLEAVSEMAVDENASVLRIAGPSHNITPVASFVRRALGPNRLQIVATDPTRVARMIVLDSVDVVISSSSSAVSQFWEATEVAHSPVGVFAPPEVVRELRPFPALPTAVMGHDFVMPSLTDVNGWIHLHDGFPVDARQRRVGDVATSSHVAAELAAAGGGVVVVAWTTAHPFVQRGALREVPVLGMDAKEPWYLTVRVDRVSTRVRDGLILAIRECVQSLAPPAARGAAPGGGARE